MTARRRILIAFAAALSLSPVAASAQTTPAAQPPPFAVRGMPTDGHEAMQVLAGTWNVEMTLYAAMGTPEDPVSSTDLIARREWIGDGRYLRDITEGTIAGAPYWRMGTLGYSGIDRAYEWVTQDAATANMMIYRGAPDAGPGWPATLSGTFTDPGIIGEDTVGRPIAQRTVITVDGPDRHTIEIFFTPPGGEERLADRKIYTRRAD